MRRLALFALLVGTLPAFADWPQWRGPKNDGHATATGLPTTWSESENVAWKCALPGTGASTPCIVGGNIFLTCQEGGDIVLLAIGTDGAIRWKNKLGSSKATFRNDEGNLASASCSADAERVYAFTGTGRLAAYDFAGKEVWGFDAQEKYGAFAIQFGIHQTPVLHKGVYYVTLLHRKAQLVIALDAKTGSELWKVTRSSDGKGESPDVYCSAIMWEKGNDALLIVHGNDYCTAHKPTNGAEVWRVVELNPKARYNTNWRAVSSPLVTPDLIVVPSCKRGVTVGIDPTTAKGTIEPGGPGELWRIAKDTPDVPSPILVDDVVYIMGEGGFFYAYDAKTGKEIYSQRITNMRHRASPVLADGKLYLLGRDGVCVVAKPGREFEKLASNKLPDTFTASPAIDGNTLYLRGFANLWAIRSSK